MIRFLYHINRPLVQALASRETQSFVHVPIDPVPIFRKRSHVPHVQGNYLFTTLVIIFNEN